MEEGREKLAACEAGFTVPLIHFVRKLAAQGHLLHLQSVTVNSSG